MADVRLQKLAKVLIHHSTAVKNDDHVLIEAFDIPRNFISELIDNIRQAGAHPHLHIRDSQLVRQLLHGADKEQLRITGEHELALMRKMDVYIGIRGSQNVREMADVPGDDLKNYQELILKPVHFKERVNNTRWVILRYPNPSFAQQAGMSTRAFEKFFFDVCTMDYQKMEKAMAPLVARMESAKSVRLKGPGTDLSFSIEGIPVIGCSGRHNIPDGEVFTAPVKNSVNGTIRFNTATIYQGKTFSDVSLTFKDGQIVTASADKSRALNEILDTDVGARYIGEFAISFNPYVTEPMLDILFDEKIAGSFHFTPGQAYEDADNGNRSNIHWDMVMRQTADQGGGEIYFDEQLIRKDGLFVPAELQPLNPENLLG